MVSRLLKQNHIELYKINSMKGKISQCVMQNNFPINKSCPWYQIFNLIISRHLDKQLY